MTSIFSHWRSLARATVRKARRPAIVRLPVGVEMLESRLTPAVYKYFTFDVPSSTLGSQAYGINDSGQIVGTADLRGFLLNAGSYTSFSDPAGFGYTIAFGVNASGQIAGYYGETPLKFHGFLLSGGSYTTVDVPGASNTFAARINASGQIVGSYVDPQNKSHGFLLSGGSYTTLDVPGAAATNAAGINTSGQIVGSSDRHGFLLSGGTYTPLNVPGATSTDAATINDTGQIVGDYYDAQNRIHGFVLTNGSYTTLDIPGAIQTFAEGINNAGLIVGWYRDPSNNVHSFLATPVQPPIFENLSYVIRLYHDLLRRAPDSGGLAFWTGLLNRNQAASFQVASAFVNSQEFRTQEVKDVYHTFLHRDADPSGLSSWTEFLVRGNSAAQLEAQIVASPEYLQRRAGGNTNNLLATLFTDAFHRPLDPAGRELYGDHDFDRSTARRRVAEQILASTDFHQDWVQNSYWRFLNRRADPGGLSAATAALNNGERDETIVAVLLGSPEYLATVVPPGFKPL